ncbi:MAG: YfhO family protein [Candidatus Omnitrophica bacterium]|nr:YfhO family protein [Candidatus Omnitrophota bacterium]
MNLLSECKTKKVTAGRPELLLLAVIVVILNLPVLQQKLWFTRDTIYAFHIFYAFYSNLFQNHEFMQWLPYGSYGIPFDMWQLVYFSPSSYLSSVLGVLLSVKNTLTVFKLSMMFEQWMLLTGAWLLGEQIFKYKYSCVLICLALITTAIWPLQIFWNFRIYYLLPLIFFYLVRWIKSKNPAFFWMAGIVALMGEFGQPLYYVALHLLIFILFGLIAISKHRSVLKNLLERSCRNIIPALIFAGVALIYAYFILHMFDGITSDVVGRNAVTREVPLNTFLTIGTGINFEKFYALFFPNTYPDTGDTTLYIGFIPLIFIVYALLNCRKLFFGAFALMTFLLICFSVGDYTFIARAFYHLFPPIHYMRYLGIMSALIRFFLVILAGFGLDEFLWDFSLIERFKSMKRQLRNSLFLSVTIPFLLCMVIYYFNSKGHYYPIGWSEYFFFGIFLIICMAILMLRGSMRIRQKLIWAILIFYALDMFVFNTLFMKKYPNKWDWISDEIVDVQPVGYQKRRGDESDFTERQKEANRLIWVNHPFKLGKEAYQFLLYDPCLPRKYALFHWSTLFWNLRQMRFRNLYYIDWPTAMRRLNAAEGELYGQVLGCRSDKLRFLPDVFFANTPEEAARYVHDGDIGKIPMIEKVPENIQKLPHTLPADMRQQNTIEVSAYSFNRIRMKVNVVSSERQWLYYADVYYPGWHAYMDGKEIPIYPANLAFKAVLVERGEHALEFVFRPGLEGFVFKVTPYLGMAFGLFMWTIFISSIGIGFLSHKH